MSYGRRLAVCALLSVLGHAWLASAARHLPLQADADPVRTVEVRVVAPPPPPDPPPPEPPPPEPEKPITPLKAHPRVTGPSLPDKTPRDVVPTDRPTINADPDAEPVYGVSMESTSQAGSGPEVPVGNTVQVAPGAGSGSKKAAPLAAPAEAYEVTAMPVPEGRCSGKYTEAARAAAVEGTVVLDLVVGADGRAREIHVVQGLGQGLTEAAVAALGGCRFKAGVRNGQPVAVRVRGFKIRFLLADNP